MNVLDAFAKLEHLKTILNYIDRLEGYIDYVKKNKYEFDFTFISSVRKAKPEIENEINKIKVILENTKVDV